MAAADLKRLGFLPEASASLYATASSLYASGKAYVPASLAPRLEGVEARLASASKSPYLAAASEKGVAALQAVDAKVDNGLLAAWGAYASRTSALGEAVGKQRAAHAAHVARFEEARATYLKRVEEGAAFLRQQGLNGAAKLASDTLLAKVEEAKRVPSVLLGEVQDAWGRLAAMPAVVRLVGTSRAQVDAAAGKYQAAHDALVASPAYASALSRGEGLVRAIHGSTPYQTAAARLYPLLAPLAEPAAKAASPYIAAVAAHLAPVAAA